MTHPVHAAIQRGQALLARPAVELDQLAERIVDDLRAAAAADDPAAAAVIARLKHLADKGRPSDGYHAGCIVAEYLNAGTDYSVSAFAARYGRALLRARQALSERAPDPDGNGYRWSDETIAATTEACTNVSALTRPLVLVPAGAQVMPRG